MAFGRFLVWLNCALFIGFGLGFMLAPEALAALVTGAAPATSSGVTDMRATYGGMALGLAILLGLCARTPAYVQLGLQGVLVVMVALVVGRLIGMTLDGAPNIFMFVLLFAELVMAGLVVVGLRQQSVGALGCKTSVEPTG